MTSKSLQLVFLEENGEIWVGNLIFTIKESIFSFKFWSYVNIVKDYEGLINITCKMFSSIASLKTYFLLSKL